MASNGLLTSSDLHKGRAKTKEANSPLIRVLTNTLSIDFNEALLTQTIKTPQAIDAFSVVVGTRF